MTSVVRQLLRIKEIRESKAARELSHRHALLADAIRERQAAELNLEAGRDLSVRRERELYAKIFNQRVSLRDIEDIKLEVARMQEMVKTLAQSASNAAEAASAAHERREKASTAWAAAVKDKQKLEELARRETECRGREAERQEDIELEEIDRHKPEFVMRERRHANTAN